MRKMSEPIGNTTIRIGILTVSDRASRGEYEDTGGPAVIAELKAMIQTPWEAIKRIVPDERDAVAKALKELSDRERCHLIVTTGGTGPALRDVTPDATADVCAKMLPGFGEVMRAVSLKKVPTAMLSRQTAGIRGACLIINLPGKPSAITTCLRAVFPAVPDCVDLLGGPSIETNPDVIGAAFHPHKGPTSRP